MGCGEPVHFPRISWYIPAGRIGLATALPFPNRGRLVSGRGEGALAKVECMEPGLDIHVITEKVHEQRALVDRILQEMDRVVVGER